MKQLVRVLGLSMGVSIVWGLVGMLVSFVVGLFLVQGFAVGIVLLSIVFMLGGLLAVAEDSFGKSIEDGIHIGLRPMVAIKVLLAVLSIVFMVAVWFAGDALLAHDTMGAIKSLAGMATTGLGIVGSILIMERL